MANDLPQEPIAIDARNWTGDVEADLRVERQRREAQQVAFKARVALRPVAYGIAFLVAGLGMMALPSLAPSTPIAGSWDVFAETASAWGVGVISCGTGIYHLWRGYQARLPKKR